MGPAGKVCHTTDITCENCGQIPWVGIGGRHGSCDSSVGSVKLQAVLPMVSSLFVGRCDKTKLLLSASGRGCKLACLKVVEKIQVL